MKRVHVFITGDVTGVGYRYWTKKNAERLRLGGWIRNADRETVEAVFEGEKEKVEEMIKLCHKGPEISWVEKVEVRNETVEGNFDGFEIRS